LVVAGLLVLGLAIMLTAGCQKKSASNAAPPVATPEEPAPVAQSDAAVQIVAYYPLNEDHKYIVDYLKEFEKKYPGEVSVEVNDMQSPEGRKKWQETELSCAGVFVNGKTRHEITRDGKTETVDFLKRMDSFWTREDFEAVVEDLLAKSKAEK
jgi:hypothetical protein